MCTETWLEDSGGDDLYIFVLGRSFLCNRSAIMTDESMESCICVLTKGFVKKKILLVREICTPDTELLLLSLRPLCLPKEFFHLVFTIIYIHPKATSAPRLTAVEILRNCF